MFVGHLALGLAARRVDRRASLVWFVSAVTLVDLIWPIFMLVGLEHARVDPGNTAFTPLASNGRRRPGRCRWVPGSSERTGVSLGLGGDYGWGKRGERTRLSNVE